MLQNKEDKSEMQNGKIVLFFLQYTATELLHTANKLFQAFSGILHMEILESDSSSTCCLKNITFRARGFYQLIVGGVKPLASKNRERLR